MSQNRIPGRGGSRHGERHANWKARSSRSAVSTKPLDFKSINRSAVGVLPIILGRWLPQGRRVGREYVAFNPTRRDRHLGSFKVAISGPRIGMWADFATGDKGHDLISLAAYLFGLSQTEAARRIADMLGCRHD
jgi:hypothetical protein